MPANAGIQYAAPPVIYHRRHGILDHPLSRMMTNEVELAPSSSLLQILLHLRAQIVAQIGARHAEGDIGAEETGLGAAIVPLALEFDAVEVLGFGEPDHPIGKLDLAAGAALLGFQDFENFRLQNVAPGDRQ